MRTLIEKCGYRRSIGPSLPNGASHGGARDTDLVAIGLILWGVSLWRVVLAFSQHEVFGTEATLALGCVFFIPWLWWRSGGGVPNGDDSGAAPGRLILLHVPSETLQDAERSRRA